MEKLEDTPKSSCMTDAQLDNLNRLKHMHSLMMLCEDENIYFAWVETFPDSPSYTDFEEIAMDEEMMKRCYKEFCRLIQSDGYL